MSTIFKFATATTFEPRNINQATDASATNPPRTRAAAISSTPATRQDTAALSASSALSASAATSDVSRSAHIEALRQSINDGTYYVSAEDVAASIIHSLL